MKCSRKEAGVTTLGRLGNGDIRNRTDIGSCIEHKERQHIQWLGHLMTMEDKQLPSSPYSKMCSLYGARRRPRKIWIDNVKDILKKHGYNAAEGIHLALERKLRFSPLQLTASVDQ